MGVLKARPHLQLLALRAREQGLKHFYFDPPELTSRLTNRCLTVDTIGLDLANVDLIFCPINLNRAHWFLIVVDILQK